LKLSATPTALPDAISVTLMLGAIDRRWIPALAGPPYYRIG
jgi:hypothetical protein